jgi:uncharacterized protein
MNNRKIAVFLMLTAVLSSIVYAMMAAAGSFNAQGGAYTLLLMWCPGVSALATQLIFERRISGLGWRLPAGRYVVLGYAIPLVYAAAAYAIIWLAGWGRPSLDAAAAAAAATTGMTPTNPTAFAIVYLIVTSTVGIIGSVVSALGEEIGWRGFLVPELAKQNTFLATALISGVIWALWHVPGVFLGYNGGTPIWYGLPWFAIGVIGISVIAAWLRLDSGSLWPAVLLHASHNLFVQSVFGAATADTGHTAYYAGEFGAVLPVLIVVAAALVIWRRRASSGQISRSGEE